MITVKTAKTPDEIAECFRIRAEVFIVEQNVPLDMERDEYDASAIHFLAESDGQPVGTARVVLKENGSVAKIGRVAVLKLHRETGIGKMIMSAIAAAPELKHVDSFMLEAQTHALSFYKRLGYEPFGDEFLDVGIPHRRMKKQNIRHDHS